MFRRAINKFMSSTCTPLGNLVVSITSMEVDAEGPVSLFLRFLAQLRPCCSSLKTDKKQLGRRLDQLTCASTASFSTKLSPILRLLDAIRSPVMGSFRDWVPECVTLQSLFGREAGL